MLKYDTDISKESDIDSEDLYKKAVVEYFKTKSMYSALGFDEFVANYFSYWDTFDLLRESMEKYFFDWSESDFS